MTIEFIDMPVSGTYDEKHFGDTRSNNSWVKFTDSELKSWVGSFAQGFTDAKESIPINENLSFIVVKGNGYLLDCNKRELVTETVTGITSAIVDNQQGEIYFSNGFDLKKIDQRVT